jgi:OmpA-OmpF porin, OOP family
MALAGQSGGYGNSYKKLSFGLHGGMLTMLGDIKQYPVLPGNDELRFGGGVAVNYQFSPVVGLRFHGMAGQLAGNKGQFVFGTDLIELGLGFTLSMNHWLFPSARISQWMSFYGFAGLGVVHHATSLTKGNLPARREEDIIPVVPFGVGLKFRLSERIDFHIESGQRMTDSDRLDGFVAEGNDSYNYTSAGIRFRIGSKSRSEQWRSRYGGDSGISVMPLYVATRTRLPEDIPVTAQPEPVPEPEPDPNGIPHVRSELRSAQPEPIPVPVSEPEPETGP